MRYLEEWDLELWVLPSFLHRITFSFLGSYYILILSELYLFTGIKNGTFKILNLKVNLYQVM
jgi:hypothetical protein